MKKAAEKQELKMGNLLQEMKVEIAEHMTQMEKTSEMLKKNGCSKVFKSVELIRASKEHEITMVTKLDVIQNEQHRDCSTQNTFRYLPRN